MDLADGLSGYHSVGAGSDLVGHLRLYRDRKGCRSAAVGDGDGLAARGATVTADLVIGDGTGGAITELGGNHHAGRIEAFAFHIGQLGGFGGDGNGTEGAGDFMSAVCTSLLLLHGRYATDHGPATHLVTGGIYISILVAVLTGGTSMGGVTLCGTGRLGDHDGIVVTLSSHFPGLGMRAVCALALLAALFGAGSGFDHGPSAHLMSGGGHFAVLVAMLTGGTGMCGVAACSTGGLGNNGRIVVTLSSYVPGFGVGAVCALALLAALFGAGSGFDHGPSAHLMSGGSHFAVLVAMLTGGAGVGGVAACSTGGLGNNGGILMSGRCYIGILVTGAAAATGMCGVSVCGTGRLSRNSLLYELPLSKMYEKMHNSCGDRLDI